MKLHKAAALALVGGWYLMLPPAGPNGRRLTDERLLYWNLIDQFDSIAVCRHMRAQLIERMPGTAIDTSRCVDSNDPDLLPPPEPGIGDDLEDLGGV
jgi:hypothetical protein